MVETTHKVNPDWQCYNNERFLLLNYKHVSSMFLIDSEDKRGILWGYCPGYETNRLCFYLRTKDDIEARNIKITPWDECSKEVRIEIAKLIPDLMIKIIEGISMGA